MSEPTEIAHEVERLSANKGFQAEAAQIRAKASLAELLGEAPHLAWSYVLPRVIRNATALMADLQSLADADSNTLRTLSDQARSLAQIWESLAKLGEGATKNAALINAAAAYQLAGYEANSACIARKVTRTPPAADIPSLTDLAALFLQRLFLKLERFATLAGAEPPAPADGLTDSFIDRVALALAAKGITAGSLFFRSGNGDTIDQARRLLSLAEEAYVSHGKVSESVQCHLLQSLLHPMRSRSTWQILGTLCPHPLWHRYLQLLARGLGTVLQDSPSISELWPSQIGALEQGLLEPTRTKFVRMPTSAGKTRVAELAIVYELITNPNARCIYVAPYRALVSELEQSFFSVFVDLGFTVTSLTGSYDTDELELSLAVDSRMLVLTPEKLDLIYRTRPEVLENTTLVVLDEWHVIDDRSRGTKYELLLTRLKRRLRAARFLFVSAVVPDATLNSFAKWFNAQATDILRQDWRPAIQRIAKFEWRGASGTLRYQARPDIAQQQEFLPRLIQVRQWEFINERTGRKNRIRFPSSSNKAQTCAELAFKFGELGPVLIFCSQPNFVESVCKALQDRLALASEGADPSAFPRFTSGASGHSRAVAVAEEWLGDQHKITRFLRTGIALHHGRLPDALRKAVESDFRERRFRILVATNTLAQGVNLPIRTVIVHSCWRTNEDGTQERLTARDYWNIAGRAGRAREETEGLVVHVVNTPHDQWDYEYYLSRQSSVEEINGGLFKLLSELVQRRLSEDAAADELSPDVLALLVEESLPISGEEGIQTLARETLAGVRGGDEAEWFVPLENILRKTRDTVLAEAPDPAIRSVFGATGLGARSCGLLWSRIQENETRIVELFATESLDDRASLARLFLDDCATVSEAEPRYQFAGDYLALMEAWLSGEHIDSLRGRFGAEAQSVESLGRFIEDFFAYRLPWVISAHMRIAERLIPLTRISQLARFFPPMVRFGVPFPQAAWAMSVGIPSRRLGIEMGQQFLKQTQGGSYRNFVEWLSSLEGETLRANYKLDALSLQEITRSVSRVSGNPLLDNFAGLESMMPIATQIAGIRHDQRSEVAKRANVDDELKLRRDFDNAVDRNAVAVYLAGDEVGYLPRSIAQLLAPEMDSGRAFKAVVTEIKRRRIPIIHISISL